MIYFSPVFGSFLSLFVWLLFPYFMGFISFDLCLLFLCRTSLGVYNVMIDGWACNTVYSLLGTLRALAEAIFYEAKLAFILFSFIVLVCVYNLFYFYYFQFYFWLIFIPFPLSCVWFISCLAETNPTPYDFAAEQSELVCGFNVKYGGGGFALMCLAEYASILFMWLLFCAVFGSDLYCLLFYVSVCFVSSVFIWVRGTFPRFRYDKLMYLS